MNEDLQQQLNQLKQEVSQLKQLFGMHQHNNVDGTNMLRKMIQLDRDQVLTVGTADHLTQTRSNGATTDFYNYYISVGPDNQINGFVNKSNNMQLNFVHYPLNASLQSFLTCVRKPVAASAEGTSISTTAAGNTVTITGFDFTTNSLAGALIDIFDSSGSLVETQTIASNTATVVTITGTWGASTSGGTFTIYVPVFLGAADQIWQRFYTQEGTPGGIRFGVGPTNGGQNGLLYMDATGDLYWRDKAGTSTKLN